MTCAKHHLYMKATSGTDVILWCGDCDKQAVTVEPVVLPEVVEKPAPARRNVRGK